MPFVQSLHTESGCGVPFSLRASCSPEYDQVGGRGPEVQRVYKARGRGCGFLLHSQEVRASSSSPDFSVV